MFPFDWGAAGRINSWANLFIHLPKGEKKTAKNVLQLLTSWDVKPGKMLRGITLDRWSNVLQPSQQQQGHNIREHYRVASWEVVYVHSAVHNSLNGCAQSDINGFWASLGNFVHISWHKWKTGCIHSLKTEGPQLDEHNFYFSQQDYMNLCEIYSFLLGLKYHTFSVTTYKMI